MKAVLVFLAVALAVVNAELAGGLRVKFELSLVGIGKDFFFDIPKTVSAALTQRWTLEKRPANQHLPSLVMMCPQPEEVCALYDDTGYVAGLQIALSKKKITSLAFNMNEQGWTEWTASSGNVFWTTQEYFVNEEYLATDAATRVANRNSNKMLQQDYVWVTGINREILAVPRKESGVLATGFTEQACIPWMGLHYYYQMRKDSVCSSTTMLPWFPMYYDGELVGMGMNTYGSMMIDAAHRDWFERPAQAAVMAIVPNGPQCLYDLAASPGIITSHTYFVDEPSLLLC